MFQASPGYSYINVAAKAVDRQYLRQISCNLSLRHVLILEFEPPEYNVRFYGFPNGRKSDLHCLSVSDVLQFFIH